MSGSFNENMKRNIFKLNGGELSDILTPYQNIRSNNSLFDAGSINDQKESNRIENGEELMHSVTWAEFYDNRSVPVSSITNQNQPKSPGVPLNAQKYVEKGSPSRK